MRSVLAWRKEGSRLTYETKPLPYIQCAYQGCPNGATVRVRKPTGWAQMCEGHYANDNLRESKDYCLKNALISTEEKIAHCRALFRKPRDPRAWMKNPKSEIARQYRDEVLRHVAERVPGEDDEPYEEAA